MKKSRTVNQRSTVAIGTGEDRIQCLRSAFAALGGIDQWVKPGHTVLLKPNMMTAMGTPTVTHIDMLKGLYLLCKEAGAARVLVGENSVCGMSARTHFEFAGFMPAFEKIGLEYADFEREDWIYFSQLDNFCLKDLHLPKSLVEADVWITVPVAKTHEGTSTTLGVKNLHGVLADEDKARHHRGRQEMGSDLMQKFADIYNVARPDLCVCDMFQAMEGQGPAFGRLVEPRLVVVSEDTIACDAIVEDLMGFDNLEGLLTSTCHQRQLGVGDTDRIDVVGAKVGEHRRRFERAQWRPLQYEGEGLDVLTGDVCHGGCQMLLRYIIDSSKIGFAKDAREFGPLYILCGLNPPPPPENSFVVVYGDCAIYSSWHYQYRKKPRKIGPWWNTRPAFQDVPGCCPLQLNWLKQLAKLTNGYCKILSLVDGIEVFETIGRSFATGVPLEKNPRRWHYDPEFARRYAKEIKESKPPRFHLKDERIKGDTYAEFLKQDLVDSAAENDLPEPASDEAAVGDTDKNDKGPEV